MEPSQCRLDTFLRWTNFRLRGVQFRSPLPPEKRVLSSLSDLSDGVLLSELSCMLCQKEPIRTHYQPRVSSRKLENIHTSLSLLREHGVRLISVGPEDILRGDLSSLCGLIWSLIVRFQLSGDSNRASKKSVLLWTRAVLPNENIPDLATSWRNGMLLHKLVSYLIPTAHSTLLPSNHGMLISTAKKELNVEDILSADWLTSVDEESMATYLSLFLVAMTTSLVTWLRGMLESSAPKGLLTEEWRNGDLLARLVRAKCPDSPAQLRDLSEVFAFLRDKLDVSPAVTARELREGRVDLISLQTLLLQVRHSATQSCATNCSVSGRGVVSAAVGMTSSFSVDTRSAGRGLLSVDIRHQTGTKLKHSLTQDTKLSHVSYTPSHPGVLLIDVTWSGEHIPNSPFRILATDPSAVKLIDGSKEIQVSRQHEVSVGTEGAGEGTLKGRVLFSDGTADWLEGVKRDGAHSLLFTPQKEGDISLDILWNNSPISESPLRLSAVLPHSYHLDTSLPPRDSDTGDILGVRVGQSVCLRVRSTSGGFSELRAEARHLETGAPLSVSSEAHRAYCNLWLSPARTGLYKIQVFVSDMPVSGSPVLLPVSDASQLILLSPPNLPACMQLSCPMELTLNAESAGPAHLTFHCDRGVDCSIFRNGDSIVATLLPGSIGEFMCSLKWGTEHIPNSPFRVTVCDIRQVSVTGGVLEGELGVVGEELEFIVLYEMAGISNCNDVTLNLSARGPTADYIVATQDEGLGHTVASFTPWEAGEHQLEILLGDIELENSPFYFDVIGSDVMSANAYGAGLQQAKSGVVSEFYIRSKQSDVLQSDRLGVRIHSMHGEVPHWLVQREDGDYKVEYTPKRPGAYLVELLMDGEHFSGSPFKVSVHQDNQEGEMECLLSGPALNPEVKFTLGQPVDFTADATRCPPAQLSVSAVCQDTFQSARVVMHQYRQGFFQVNIDPPGVGLYSVSVSYGDNQSADSPFFVEIVPSDTDSTRCSAYGSGLSHATVGERTEFFVSTQGAGRGALAVSVEGVKSSFVVYVDPTPEDSKLLCCRYKPRSPGTYWISLKWSGLHIPGSPYQLEIGGEMRSESLTDSLAESLRQTLPPDSTEDYVSSEDDTLLEVVSPPPAPPVTPVKVAQVAEDTPTHPKGRVMAHISHFEKQASVDETAVPRRPSDSWSYQRAISQNRRQSQMAPEAKMPVIPETAVNIGVKKVGKERGADNLAENRGMDKVAQFVGMNKVARDSVNKVADKDVKQTAENIGVSKVARESVNKVAEEREPLEHITRGVVSSLVRKSEQLQTERNVLDSPTLRNLRKGGVRRTREQLTDSTHKDTPVKPPDTAETARNVAINRTEKSKDKIRAKKSADRVRSKRDTSDSREVAEEKVRKKAEKRSKGKKLDAGAEKNVSFSAEVATHHIPKDKQKTGLLGIFEKKETKHRRPAPVPVHRTLQTGSIPASLHQQQKKLQQFSNPYLTHPYNTQMIPTYYPPYVPQYLPVPQMYQAPAVHYQAPAVQYQAPSSQRPGHYKEKFAEQTSLFY